MKYLALVLALVIAPAGFAKTAEECVSLKDAQANLYAAIQVSPDYDTLSMIWNLEYTTEEVNYFLEDLQFTEERQEYRADEDFKYYFEQDKAPLQGYVAGTVKCDGAAEVKIYYTHD